MPKRLTVSEIDQYNRLNTGLTRDRSIDWDGFSDWGWSKILCYEPRQHRRIYCDWEEIRPREWIFYYIPDIEPIIELIKS
jgi:hypothetical protein